MNDNSFTTTDNRSTEFPLKFKPILHHHKTSSPARPYSSFPHVKRSFPNRPLYHRLYNTGFRYEPLWYPGPDQRNFHVKGKKGGLSL